jgi:esterase/lipase superfamily enzyme
MRQALQVLLVMLMIATLGCQKQEAYDSRPVNTATSTTSPSLAPDTVTTGATEATSGHTVGTYAVGTGTFGTDGTGMTATAMPVTAVPRTVELHARTKTKQFTAVTVFYATDRNLRKTDDLERRYGARRSSQLTFGTAAVSIPREHRMGGMESPSLLKFEFRPDPAKHIVLLSVSRFDGSAEFLHRLGRALNERPERQLLVFIHGFNVSFGGAIKRTAQIAYDLDFPGIPIAYTWPSQAKLSAVAYVKDTNAADVTAAHLRDFLTALATRTGAARIHVIAHSMGNRVLARALADMSVDRSLPHRPIFSEVMLTAPDIDADVMQELASRFVRLGERFTLYASQRDRALIAAHEYANSRRAGEGGANILVLPHIDSIDASRVDTDLVGHSYYADNRSILSDMFYLLRDNRDPDGRFGMHRHVRAGQVYWEFAP